MTATQVPTAEHGEETVAPVTGGRRWSFPRWATATVGFVAVLVVLAVVWEAYKAFGQAVGDTFPGTSLSLPVSTDDRSMPHLLTIVRELGEPATRGSTTSLLGYLLVETSVTLRTAFYGLVLGSGVGWILAVVISEARVANRAFMPWLIASQTVPLVAIAPMVVIWGGAAGLPVWASVTFMAAYLAFFPVTINAARGLRSVQPVQLDVLRAAGAGRVTTLRLLRLPASLPFLFAGLRLAATSAVVGAIVGELSAGTGRGVGRSILTFAYYYSSGPAKLYAAVLVAALAGIVFVQAIALLEAFVLRHRPSS